MSTQIVLTSYQQYLKDVRQDEQEKWYCSSFNYKHIGTNYFLIMYSKDKLTEEQFNKIEKRIINILNTIVANHTHYITFHFDHIIVGKKMYMEFANSKGKKYYLPNHITYFEELTKLGLKYVTANNRKTKNDSYYQLDFNFEESV